MIDNAKKRLVIGAAIETIATACLTIYGEDIEAAKAGGNIMRGLRNKQDMLRDFETWTAPLAAALEELNKPPLVVEYDARN